MCTTCMTTLSQSASLGTPALAAGAAALLTGVRLRFSSQSSTDAADATVEEPEGEPVAVSIIPGVSA